MSHRPQGVVILDFGDTYTQLIARKVRECGVYSTVLPHTTDAVTIRAHEAKGVILSGSPAGVLDEGAPLCSRQIFEMGIPVLGI
ncbi:MAG: GMP synthase (glutamine-hydrolyzing), partial [Clostridia bacterium]|nr:GMP synthase (glutamine-hydrolyzing) [Clostridia bacterium]